MHYLCNRTGKSTEITMDINEIRSKHKLLRRWEYKWTPLDKGYTDKSLYINVGTLI